MPESDANAPLSPPPKADRKLTGFYVVLGVVVVLGLFGVWFWKVYTVWWFDADEAKRRQVAAAAKLSIPVEKSVDLGGGVTLDLVLVPAGRFKMGSPATDAWHNFDEEQHWVVITRPFYLGKYEVTQEQWEKVTGANPSHFKGAKNPVEQVSWNDSRKFLKKLNALGEERGQFRLPTEAEWEWACRAGTRTGFCSGDASEALVDYAWFDANSGRTTHPVGTRKPNAWGLFDMHGNVIEWCGDWYSSSYYYAESMRHDPTGPDTGPARVGRGGSWSLSSISLRSSGRSCYDSADMYRSVGFRVALVPAGP